jgi:hypothetical protein
MKTRMMRKIAVLVAGSALAVSFPVAGAVANQGGEPNDGGGHSKACVNQQNKSQGHGPKKAPPNGKGHKCAFNLN